MKNTTPWGGYIDTSPVSGIETQAKRSSFGHITVWLAPVLVRGCPYLEQENE